MEIKLANGKKISTFQQYPPGSPLNPLSRDELRRKFSQLARAVLPDNRIEEVVETVERIETLDDASELVVLLTQ